MNAAVLSMMGRRCRRARVAIPRATRMSRCGGGVGECALFTALSPVDLGNACDPLASIRVFQIDDVVVRPVEVVGDEGYLLGQLTEGVAQDSPERAGSRRN